jgi:hypothetical protein
VAADGNARLYRRLPPSVPASSEKLQGVQERPGASVGEAAGGFVQMRIILERQCYPCRDHWWPILTSMPWCQTLAGQFFADQTIDELRNGGCDAVADWRGPIPRARHAGTALLRQFCHWAHRAGMASMSASLARLIDESSAAKMQDNQWLNACNYRKRSASRGRSIGYGGTPAWGRAPLGFNPKEATNCQPSPKQHGNSI